MKLFLETELMSVTLFGHNLVLMKPSLWTQAAAGPVNSLGLPATGWGWLQTPFQIVPELYLLINKPKHLQRHRLRSLSQMSTPFITCLSSSTQALMQTWAFLHWKNVVVMVCGRGLVWTPLLTLALASGSGHSIMVSHQGAVFATRPLLEPSSLFLLIVQAELTPTDP